MISSHTQPRSVPQHLKIIVDNRNAADETSLRQMPGLLLLDEAYITAQIAQLSESDLYFSRRGVTSFVEKVSRRVADRMARAFERE